MDEDQKYRLRTLSSFRTEDPFLYHNYSRRRAEEMLEDNEDKYKKNGLESCLKSSSPRN